MSNIFVGVGKVKRKIGRLEKVRDGKLVVPHKSGEREGSLPPMGIYSGP